MAKINIIQESAKIMCKTRILFCECPVEHIKKGAKGRILFREKNQVSFIIFEGMYVGLRNRSNEECFLLLSINGDEIEIENVGKCSIDEIEFPFQTWYDGFEYMKKKQTNER